MEWRVVVVKRPAWFSLGLLYGLLLSASLLSLFWNLVALPLNWVLPRTVGRRLGRVVIAWGYRVFWAVANRTHLLRTDLRAIHGLRHEPGLIVVANHPSMMDAMLLISQLPRGVCVMKASLMRNILLGPGARLARYIPNDRPRTMIQCAVADLQEGGQLVLFPEGTRTSTAPLDRFLPGFTLIGKMAQVPIQTVLIDTVSPYLRKGWPLWKLPPLPIVFSVRLGRRFAPGDDPLAQLADIESYFQSEMAAPTHVGIP